MKVLLFTNYGVGIPDVLKPLLKSKSFEECRTGAIVDYIERNAVPFDLNSTQFCGGNKALEVFLEYNDIVLLKTDDTQKEKTFAAKQNNEIVFFVIKDIDTSKRWRLDEYDGAEALYQIDKLECISEKLNIWRESLC